MVSHRHGYLLGWYNARNVADHLYTEHEKRDKESGIGRLWLVGRHGLGTVTRTPAFGFCDTMSDGEWTCELQPMPDAPFSTVKAAYEVRKSMKYNDRALEFAGEPSYETILDTMDSAPSLRGHADRLSVLEELCARKQ